MLNVRNESSHHRRLVCFSEDGATNWTTPVPDDALPEPICMAGMAKVGGDLAFCNPVTPNPPSELKAGQSWARENLTLRISPDDGATWPYSRVLDPGIAGYSDLAAGPDGSILCLYEGGSSDTGGFPWIAFVRVKRA
jgi:sialidase-1